MKTTVSQDRFDKRVAPSVARNVAKAAMESGVARIEVDPQDVYDKNNETYRFTIK